MTESEANEWVKFLSRVGPNEVIVINGDDAMTSVVFGRALAHVSAVAGRDEGCYGIAIATMDGSRYYAGDASDLEVEGL